MERYPTVAPARGLMGAIAGVAVVAALASLALVMGNLSQEQHAAFGTSSDGVVWGLPVATYIYFALASTGLMFVASLAMVFGIKSFQPIAKRCVWLAIATLAAGFTALAFEMGHPFRMLWALPLSFQIRSPLNWMGVFYAAALVLLVVKFRMMAREDWSSPASKRLGAASLVVEVLAAGTLGLAFSIIAARPVWFGGTVPLYFILTALLTGVALAVFATYLAYGFDGDRLPSPVRALMSGAMPRVFAVVLGLTIVAVAARTVSGVWSHQEGFQAFDRMVASPWFHAEVWLGLALPFVLLVMPGTRASPRAQVAAAALVLVAVFLGRYEFVVGGQIVPVMKGIAAGEFAAYAPSLTEVMLTVLSISIVVAAHALGERHLRLDASPLSAEETAGWLAEGATAPRREAATRAQYAPAAAD